MQRFAFLAITAVALLLVACSSQSKRIEELNSTAEPAPSVSADELRVVDSGFVWDGETLSYAFTVENRSDTRSFEETVVQVSIYGKAGEAVGSDTGFIDFILPGQVVAHAGRVPMDEEPERISLAFGVSRDARVENANTFQATNGRFSETAYGGRVVTAIKNPYERELRRLQVVAILRGEDGKILNGGSAVLELLPGRAESTVTIEILGAPPVPPASVDVYTQFSAETVFRLR